MLLTHALCAGSTVPHLAFVAVYETPASLQTAWPGAALELAAAVQGVQLEGLPFAYVCEAVSLGCYRNCYRKPAWHPTEARFELIIRST